MLAMDARGAEGGAAAAVPVTVIGGFLGAGKTSVVNHLLAHAQGRRLGVIVNDFGSINIDAALVVGVEGDMVQLSNGCICCSIREDLVEGMQRLLDRPEPPDHVIIEASGVSDPRGVAATLQQRVSRQVAAIDAVVVVIDVEQHLQHGLRERIVAGGQLAAADILVLNKIDLVDDAELESLEAKLRRRSRGGRVLRATHGKVAPALVLGVGAFDPERLADAGAPPSVHVREAGEANDHTHDHAAEYWTWSFQSERPLSAKRLRRVVDHLPASVVRAKGTVHLASHPEQRAVMHVVGRRAELCVDEPWGDRRPATRLVLIGTGEPLPPHELEQRLRACEVDPESAKPGGLVMRWMRGMLPSRRAG